MKKENAGVHVGVDVGKFQLDLFIWEREKHFCVENSTNGIKEALKVLGRYKIHRIVMEATGRYEMRFALAAFERHLPVCIVRPVLISSVCQSR